MTDSPHLEAERHGSSRERAYFIHAGRTRPKLPAEVGWWDRARAEYITITITITATTRA